MENPKRLGIVSRMEPYEDMTASYLTEAVGNVVSMKEVRQKYRNIDSMCFEWEIAQNQIKYISFAEQVEDDGENGSEITMAFTERYYELYDTFVIEESKQQCFVVESPVRKADNYWVYSVRLMGGDREARLVTDACYKGAKTRWLGNVIKITVTL